MTMNDTCVVDANDQVVGGRGGASDPNPVLPVLALGKSVFGETVAIYGAEETNLKSQKWKDFLHRHDFHVVPSGLERLTIVSTLPWNHDRMGHRYIFGGRAFHQLTKQLVVGDKDVSRHGIDVRGLRERVWTAEDSILLNWTTGR